MEKKRIDLSYIKENDFEKTSSFTDLMSRSERRQRQIEKTNNFSDIEDMIEERKKSTKDLTIELEKAKDEYRKDIEEEIGKTQILELTRKMKVNLEETKKENNNKNNSVTLLNFVGIMNLLCIGFYIYLLMFTNYQDNKTNYLITGSLIVLLVILFGISVVTTKKASKIFNIFNILIIISFIAFNIYLLAY